MLKHVEKGTRKITRIVSSIYQFMIPITTGTIYILHLRWEKGSSDCTLYRESKPMSPEKTVSVFALWAAGAAAGVVVAVVENVVGGTSVATDKKSRSRKTEEEEAKPRGRWGGEVELVERIRLLAAKMERGYSVDAQAVTLALREAAHELKEGGGGRRRQPDWGW